MKSNKDVEWAFFEETKETVGYFNDLIIIIKPYIFEEEKGLLGEIKKNNKIDIFYYRKFYENTDIQKIKEKLEKFVKILYKVD